MEKKTIALFDLDETLVCIDTAAAWSEFAARKGMIAEEGYQEYYKILRQQYLSGNLDIAHHMEYALKPVKGMTKEEALQYVSEFVNEVIKAKVYSQGLEKIQYHKTQGHILIVISASCEFIVAPVVKLLGIEHVIATQPELINQRYSGLMTGIASFQQGKVTRFKQWVEDNKIVVDKTWFYSDSLNDLSLLEEADYPVATNPTKELEAIAIQRKWPILHWKKP